ncbi:MAG: CDP-alcohol phosphatidyltransferase family protein [Planctomycetota bacterium]
MPAPDPEKTDPGTTGEMTTRDFKDLRASGESAGTSHIIGSGFVAAREVVAAILIRLGITPNILSFVGFLFTCGAGYCLARGASQQLAYFYSGAGPVGWWPLWAAVMLILSGACDMLDGAVARQGRMSSSFGAILDSSLDRFSDMAIYLGCALHFAMSGNLTYQFLALIAMCNAFLISYIKARAEEIIEDCGVGYWLRGERFAAILIACLCGHVPAVLWQQAILPAFTVWRRLRHAYLSAQALDGHGKKPRSGPAPGWRGWVQFGRHPRGSLTYDLVTGLNIAYIIFAARIWPELLALGKWADPLGRLLGHDR